MTIEEARASEKTFLNYFCLYCDQEACDGEMHGSIKECKVVKMIKGIFDDIIFEMEENEQK